MQHINVLKVGMRQHYRTWLTWLYVACAVWCGDVTCVPSITLMCGSYTLTVCVSPVTNPLTLSVCCVWMCVCEGRRQQLGPSVSVDLLWESGGFDFHSWTSVCVSLTSIQWCFTHTWSVCSSDIFTWKSCFLIVLRCLWCFVLCQTPAPHSSVMEDIESWLSTESVKKLFNTLKAHVYTSMKYVTVPSVGSNWIHWQQISV